MGEENDTERGYLYEHVMEGSSLCMRAADGRTMADVRCIYNDNPYILLHCYKREQHKNK